MIERLKIRDATESILDHDAARVISHHDADGITAAGILCHTLYRLGKRFHATIISQLDRGFADRLNADHHEGVLTVFCDMGSGHPDVITEVAGDVLVIDHHTPTGELAGDKQLMIGANADILADGVQNRIISVKKGIRIGDGDMSDILEQNIDIYLDITGDAAKVSEFLGEVGVSGRLSELSEPHLRKLATALALKLLQRSSPDVIENLIGDVYTLHCEVIPNVDDFISCLHACARLNDTALALSLCLRDPTGVSHARRAVVDYQSTLVREMKAAEPGIMHGDHIKYLVLDDAEGTGIIASTVTGFLYPDQPCIVLNNSDGKIKISARGTKHLVASGLDLAEVLRIASESVGGRGGGHSIASGAAIPKGMADAFISTADSLVGAQLGGEPQ